jgi:hypothetical protein
MQIQETPSLFINFWSFDALYLNGYDNLILLVIAAILVFLLSKDSISSNIARLLNNRKANIGIALSFGIAFILFPLATDLYGDSWEFSNRGEKIISKFDSVWIAEIFSFNLLDPKTQLKFTKNIYRILSYSLNTEFIVVMSYSSAICGAFFIYLWQRFLMPLNDRAAFKVFVLLIGGCSGFSLVFYSHIELYAIQFLGMLAFFYQLYKYYSVEKSAKRILILAFLLVLNIKLHSSGILLLPLLLLILLEKYYWKSKFNSNKVLIYFLIVCGVSLLFFALYYFIFTDNYSIHHFSNNYDLVRVFLPLQSDPAQNGDYGLLSFNHFADFIHLMIFWSVPVLILFLILLAKLKKVLFDSKDLYAIILFFTSIIYLAFFFLINPIWSIPRDFDLLSTSAIPLSVLVLYSFSKILKINNKLVLVLLVLQLMSISTIVVNTSKEKIAQRVHNMGVRIYKTYYNKSANMINYNLIDNYDSITLLDHHFKTYDQLKDIHDYQDDNELSLFPFQIADYYFLEDNFEEALKYYNITIGLYRSNMRHYYDAAKTHLMLKDFESAFVYSQYCIKNKHIDENTLRVAFYSSLYTAHYQRALEYGEYFVSKYKDPEIVAQLNRLKQAIEANKNILQQNN